MPSAYAKKIVCLANSTKSSERCIAGREFDNGDAGPWVRPVSDRDGLAISDQERSYKDGTQVAVLDVVRIPFKKPQPHKHQSENHLIDDGYYWKKLGQCTFTDVLPMVETPTSLWIDGHSSYHGTNDKVPESEGGAIHDSLVLLRPKTVKLYVLAESLYLGGSERRVRAWFMVGSTSYLLSVTHPEVEESYLSKPDGSYDVSGSILCVSLADFYHGNAYKIVATILTP